MTIGKTIKRRSEAIAEKEKSAELRPIRDKRARKSPNDRKGWTERLLEEIRQGIEPAPPPARKRAGKRRKETAQRLTPISL